MVYLDGMAGLLALLLLAAPRAVTPAEEVVLNRMFPFRGPVDDAYLAQEFADNPARLHEWVKSRTHAVLIVGRVDRIDGLASGAYQLTLAPRRTSFGVECTIANSSSIAALHRGDLVIVSGRPVSPRNRALPVHGCRLEYRFTDPPKLIGASYAICLSKLVEEACRANRDCDEAKLQKLRPIVAAANRAAGPNPIGCFKPVLALLLSCERDENTGVEDSRLGVSCDQRHEIVDARNEIIVDAEGHTQRETEPFQVVQPERSSLYDAMVRAGRIKDEEP